MKTIKEISANPNWSEEDKGIIEEVVSYLINYSNIVESKEDADRIEYLIDKIQDICPHQKQWWSEEDEKIINGLIDSLTRISLNTRTDSTSPNYSFYREIDWLKSLRPQNRWKPSDEQIAQLQIVIDTYGNEGVYDPILTELLFQLKKLKEKV